LRQADLASRLAHAKEKVSKVERGERRLDVIELRAWLTSADDQVLLTALRADLDIRMAEPREPETGLRWVKRLEPEVSSASLRIVRLAFKRLHRLKRKRIAMAQNLKQTFDERPFDTVAQRLCADGLRCICHNRHWHADETTWALWNHVYDGPCFQLICLHSQLAPEGFGPTLEMALRQLRHVHESALAPMFALLLGESANPQKPDPRAALARNLARAEEAILRGELRTLDSQDRVEPLLRRATIGEFMRWLLMASLPCVSGWPPRTSKANSEGLPTQSLDIELPGATYLLLPGDNRAARSVRHILQENRARFAQGGAGMPTELLIGEQLRSAGLDASEISVKVVSRMLKPDDLRQGPRG